MARPTSPSKLPHPTEPRIRRQTLNLRKLQQKPELHQALLDTGSLIQLEMIQALAALHDPAKYRLAPTPAGAPSITQAVQGWAGGLRAKDRRRVTRAAAEDPLPGNLAALARRYGVDLADSRPVHRQLPAPDPHPRAITPTLIEQLTELLEGDDRPARGGRARASVPPHPGQDPGKIVEIVLRLHRVACIADTTERFRDEISLLAVATDDEGEVANVAPLDLGRFRAGDTRVFDPPRPLARLRTDDFDAPFPHSFQASVVLSEVELPRIANLQQALLQLFVALFVGGAATEVGAALAVVLLTVLGATVPAVLLPITLIAAAVALVGLACAVLSVTGAAAPEVFPAQTAVITLPDNSTGFDGQLVSPLDTLTFQAFGGHYELDFTWELIKQE